MRAHRSDVHKSLRVFMKQLGEMAKESASLPSANSDDRRHLRKDAKLLAHSVKSLIKNIERHEACVLWISNICEATRPKDPRDWEAKDPKEKAKLKKLGVKLRKIGAFDPLGLVDLSSALGAAFFIGLRALNSPIFKRAAEELRAAGAAHARQALEPKSKEIGDLIVKLSGPVLKRNPKWTPNAVASEICAPLNEEVIKKELWKKPLSIGAIRKRIAKDSRIDCPSSA